MRTNTQSPSHFFSIKFGLLLAAINPLIIILCALPFIVAKLLGYTWVKDIANHSDKVYVFVLFTQTIAVAAMYMLLKRRMKASGATWKDLGLRNFRKLKAAGYIIAWPFIELLFIVGIAIVAQQLGFVPPDDPSKSTAGRAIGMNGLIPALILVSLFAPIIEEVVYRGTLFPAIKKRYGLVVGILLSSFIFAVVHINPLQIIGAFALGPYLCWMYHRLGSIIPGMILHGLHNAAVMLITSSML